MKNIIIILLSIGVLFLGCFGIYYNFLKVDNDYEKNKNSYEIIGNSEMNELFTTKKQVLDLLNSQGNDIEDVKKYLEENSNYVLEEIYLYLSNEANEKNEELIEISKNDISEVSKKIFGYDLDLVFNDISDTCDHTGETVGLKYNSNSNKYEVMDGAFQCGVDNHHEWYYRNLIINKDATNIYTITVEQIWTDEVGEGDI